MTAPTRLREACPATGLPVGAPAAGVEADHDRAVYGALGVGGLFTRAGAGPHRPVDRGGLGQLGAPAPGRSGPGHRRMVGACLRVPVAAPVTAEQCRGTSVIACQHFSGPTCAPAPAGPRGTAGQSDRASRFDPAAPNVGAPGGPAWAGETVVRRPSCGMPWLIDGMNLIGSRPDGWWRDRPAARRRLVVALGRFAAGTPDGTDRPPDGAPRPVTVVFDGGAASTRRRPAPTWG